MWWYAIPPAPVVPYLIEVSARRLPVNVSICVPSAATLAPSPQARTRFQPAERIDDVGDGAVQLADGDVAAGGGPQLVGGHPGDVPGGLRRAEVAAVGERGQHVAEERVAQFGV